MGGEVGHGCWSPLWPPRLGDSWGEWSCHHTSFRANSPPDLLYSVLFLTYNPSWFYSGDWDRLAPFPVPPTSSTKPCFLFQVKWSESRSVLSDSATPRTVQSMEFSRAEYWRGEPFPSPGYLPNPGIEPRSCSLQADSLPTWAIREAQFQATGKQGRQHSWCL